MPANVNDIVAGTRRAKVETWTDAGIKARYPSARDGGAEPAEGFFDSSTDGATAAAARGALFGVERRGFTVSAQDLLWPDPAAGLPIIALIDGEQAMNGKTFPVRIELNLNEETTSFEVVG